MTFRLTPLKESFSDGVWLEALLTELVIDRISRGKDNYNSSLAIDEILSITFSLPQDLSNLIQF